MGYYRQCADCNKFVNLAKPILGSLHLCLTEEERREKYALLQLTQHQQSISPEAERLLRAINGAARALKAGDVPSHNCN